MAKTAQEFLDSIKKRLAYANPNLDLTSGNVATDLGVEAFAEELAALSSEEERIKFLYLFNSDYFTDEEAAALAASFGIYRIEATKAEGAVVFGATSLPSTGATFTIPVGTEVSTSGDAGATKTFFTTSTSIIDSNTPLNPSSNYYEVIVPVEASVAGSNSNVGPGAISVITSNVNGVSVVYNNDSITNGTDGETKESLINRVKRNLVGYVYGTKASLLNKALSYGKVTDAVIVDPNSDFSVRGPGSVDIYILGTTTRSYTQVIRDQKQESYLTFAPVIDNNTAVVVFSDDQTTLTEGNGFNIIKDTTTMYAGSNRAKDKIVWTTDAYTNYVQTHTSYSVTYDYNKLLTDIQEEFDREDSHIVTSDILVRETSQINARMDFSIVTLAGYDEVSVRNNVINAIQTYVNNLKLNQTLRQSDIIGLVEDTDGVDYVKLPMRAFCLVGEDKVGDIESSPLEYIRISTENLLID